MCNEAVDTYIFVFDFILHQYMMKTDTRPKKVWCLNSINLNNVDADDGKLDVCDPETITHVRLIAQNNRYK